ncbi:MAG TPA: hypothetical protein DEP51_02705 [Clostridiales bacterium]|nr:hypothetical protein [Clostridiales bacterium]
MKNYTKKSLKASNGITLIALVITIIVLLILAGISIAMLAGDNSILQRATDAKIKSDEAQIKERIQLAYHSALTKDITGESGELTMQTLQTELNNEFTEKTVTITPSADNKEWIIKVDNVEETVPAGIEKQDELEILDITKYTWEEISDEEQMGIYTFRDNGTYEVSNSFMIYIPYDLTYTFDGLQLTINFKYDNSSGKDDEVMNVTKVYIYNGTEFVREDEFGDEWKLMKINS